MLELRQFSVLKTGRAALTWPLAEDGKASRFSWAAFTATRGELSKTFSCRFKSIIPTERNVALEAPQANVFFLRNDADGTELFLSSEQATSLTICCKLALFEGEILPPFSKDAKSSSVCLKRFK